MIERQSVIIRIIDILKRSTVGGGSQNTRQARLGPAFSVNAAQEWIEIVSVAV